MDGRLEAGHGEEKEGLGFLNRTARAAEGEQPELCTGV